MFEYYFIVVFLGEFDLMNNKKQANKDVSSFDLVSIARLLWKKIWIIAIAGVATGIVGFVLSAFVLVPKYSSAIMLYVNNSTISIGADVSFSASQISAAQSLVKTYSVILQNRTTLEKVIDKAELDYTYEELKDMISASSVNDTEVLQVTVTCDDPREAAKIANTIADVLPRRISEIIENSSMEVVDSGVVNTDKVFPSITGFTALGMLLGAIVAVVVLSLLAIADDTIRDEEYILQNYDYPILAKIPNLSAPTSGNSYAYYYKSGSSKQ